ncbi:MAG: DUF1800 domain-containing protein [Acidobacteria bacterium]|nr:DUF1800 domain-containing protein [Acidobacteriota bacterium]
MSFFVRRIPVPVAATLLATLVFAYSTARPAGIAAASGPAPSIPPTPPVDDKTIAQLLDRLGYGARPGDLEQVREMGVTNYIEQQLHPERIDDSAREARLAPLNAIDMSTAEIAREYYIPAQQERRRQKQNQAKADPNDLAGPEKRRQPSAVMMKQREMVVKLNEQKIVRAVYGEHQFQEVLTDFWFNHFNVFAGKGPEPIMLTAYERDVIRPRVLGSFRELLGATAHSPAMLFYLDNWMSTDSNGPHTSQTDESLRRNRAGLLGVIRPDLEPRLQRQQKSRPTRLNENYGRELMELHTLDVEGGHTQKDVVEVARAFTGWTVAQPRPGGGYRFDARMHDDGEKRVLGQTIEAGGGEKDGEHALDILARHPSTARLISTKLARRFMGDDPSPALVYRAAKRFLETNGDIREVVRTLITSPDFSSPDAYRAKVKTPFEFVVSALRASSAQILGGAGLAKSLRQLGMPLYQAQPPTGYADTADAWVNTGALVSRMNFALSRV